jgi:hypothetical protein
MLLTQETKSLPVLLPVRLKGVLTPLSGKVEAGFTPNRTVWAKKFRDFRIMILLQKPGNMQYNIYTA